MSKLASLFEIVEYNAERKGRNKDVNAFHKVWLYYVYITGCDRTNDNLYLPQSFGEWSETERNLSNC